MESSGSFAAEPDGSRLHGVLVTFRRPDWLARTLERLAEQDRPLDRLVVVDNGPTEETEGLVRAYGAAGRPVDYLAMPENRGFTGGVETGMRHVLPDARDRDWIVVLDDDDLPPSSAVLGQLERFGNTMVAGDPNTACVGTGGARFDWRRGRIRRVPDHELRGAVPVDYIAGNQLPFYRVEVVRAVGPFHGRLFFGLSEIEYGLRLRRAGYSLYGQAELWLANRTRAGRLGLTIRPSRRLDPIRWKRYYSLRNTIYVLRRFGHPVTAARVTLVSGFAKPLANLVVSPRRAVEHLGLNWRASRDGWTNRMGRTVEPDAVSKRELDASRPRP